MTCFRDGERCEALIHTRWGTGRVPSSKELGSLLLPKRRDREWPNAGNVADSPMPGWGAGVSAETSAAANGGA